MRVYLDSNVPVYVAGTDHPNRAPALRFFERVRAGSVVAVTSTVVLQEILLLYTRWRRPDLATEVYDLVVQLCEEIFEVDLADTDRARDLLRAYPSLRARNATHGGLMLGRDVPRVATFDPRFDRVPGLSRMDLA